jgi:hypothetical protein
MVSFRLSANKLAYNFPQTIPTRIIVNLKIKSCRDSPGLLTVVLSFNNVKSPGAPNCEMMIAHTQPAYRQCVWTTTARGVISFRCTFRPESIYTHSQKAQQRFHATSSNLIYLATDILAHSCPQTKATEYQLSKLRLEAFTPHRLLYQTDYCFKPFTLQNTKTFISHVLDL